jgi:hypothetical protein
MRSNVCIRCSFQGDQEFDYKDDLPPLMDPTENPLTTDAAIERMRKIEMSPLFMIEIFGRECRTMVGEQQV